MKESGKDRLKCAVYESTLSTADVGPPSPMGKAKRRVASPLKKETNPASLRSAAPSRKGLAWILPSFLWKEVPLKAEGDRCCNEHFGCHSR